MLHESSPDLPPPTLDDTLSDIQSSISYLKKRLGNCASASQVESIKDDACNMANTLLDDWRQAEQRWESRLDLMSQRLDDLSSFADGYRRRIDNKTGTLSAEIEKITTKQRKIVDSTNTCISDLQVLRKDLKDLNRKHKHVAASLSKTNETEARRDPATDVGLIVDKIDDNDDNDDNDNQASLNGSENPDDLYWKTIVQNAFALPPDADWNKVRVDRERQPLLFTRVSHHKCYIEKHKMDFVGRKRIIRPEYVTEFLGKLREDCPAVLIGRKGRRYRIK